MYSISAKLLRRIWWKIFCCPRINLHLCLFKVNNDHANCDIIGNELFNSRQTGKNKANEEINFTVQKMFNTQRKCSPTWQRKIRHGIINIQPSLYVLWKWKMYIQICLRRQLILWGYKGVWFIIFLRNLCNFILD